MRTFQAPLIALLLASAPCLADAARPPIPGHKPTPAASNQAAVPSQPPTPTPGEVTDGHEPHAGGGDEQPHADIRGTDDLPLIVKILPAPKADEKPADKQEHGSGEPPRNWWSPEWATIWVGGLIGVLQLVVFGVQALRLKQTITKMDEIATKQTSDMKASIDAAKSSAEAAHKAADALPIVERAYLYPIIVSVGETASVIENASVYFLGNTDKDDVRTDERARITFIIKNFGKTPAVIKNVFAGFGIYPIGSQIGLFIPNAVLGETGDTGVLSVEMEMGITPRQAQNIPDYGDRLHLDGTIIFNDIWDREHTTSFVFGWDHGIQNMSLRGIKTLTLSFYKFQLGNRRR